jgi:hypothetical protein
MEDVKTLKLADGILSKDRFGISIGGRVVIKDEQTGEVLCSKDNLIVLRGRTFLLEKLFNVGINDTDLNTQVYRNNLNRRVCLFQIGQGGTPNGVPFVPIDVANLEMGLTSPVPFRVIDNTSIATKNATTFSPSELGKYYGKKVVGTSEEYYYKEFETQGQCATDADEYNLNGKWSLKKDEDDPIIYRLLTLRISDRDLRFAPTASMIEENKTNTSYLANYVPYVNELALFFAEESLVETDADGIPVLDSTGKTISADKHYINLEMFSRITFPSEPLGMDLTKAGANKSLIIEYYIYA